jgi:septum site-determining protein MinC
MNILGTDMPVTDKIVASGGVVPAVVLKGSVFTLPILKLNTYKCQEIEAELTDKLASALDFFKDAPVVIDVELSTKSEIRLDFKQLFKLLHKLKLVPVGVHGGSKEQDGEAKKAGFAIVSGQIVDRFLEEHVNQNDARAEESAKAIPTGSSGSPKKNMSTSTVFNTEGSTKVMYHPVRSGQRVYAKGGDLIVLAAVNPGAEIMADGNLHIYAPLRGRALAGVAGNTDSRIFCLSMEAELVAVAGNYRVFEESVPDAIYKKPVQIHLQGEQLNVEPIV